jgi:hypothetical protein
VGLIGCCFHFLFQPSPPPWCVEQVQDQSQWRQSIKHKSDESAQQAALGVKGLGHGHHQGDVNPGDGNQVHGVWPLKRKIVSVTKAEAEILIINRLSRTAV